MASLDIDEAIQDLLSRFNDPWPAVISCGKGWYPLLAELRNALVEVNPHFKIAQIKEKFGGLRFYLDGGETPEMTELISGAEEKSFAIAEETGEPGVLASRGGWMKTVPSDPLPEGWKVARKPRTFTFDSDDVKFDLTIHE